MIREFLDTAYVGRKVQLSALREHAHDWPQVRFAAFDGNDSYVIADNRGIFWAVVISNLLDTPDRGEILVCHSWEHESDALREVLDVISTDAGL
jgi:hypothetical protein